MVLLDGGALTLDDLVAIADAGAPVGLTPEARARVQAARVVVDRAAQRGTPAYGINTGFGNFAEVAIPPASLERLQLNLLRSHAAGVGAPLPVRVIRATMALRANVLAKGFSGVRPETLDLLVALLNRGVHPVVPARGSVGASGDLAPLAHLALVLVGEGEAWTGGERCTGAEALARADLRPVVLAPKEGLALINGTQPSTAVLALALAGAERLARTADIAAALSIDGLQGSTRPFDPRIHAARGLPAQAVAADNVHRLMAGSGINAAHANCGRVQDAYSMRCTPQVHGAARHAFACVRSVVEAEINAATDNPMVFADTGEIVSGGNFHGAPVAVAADILRIGLAQLVTISERRTDRLVNPVTSGLPAFLVREGGLQSGLMLAQVTAAALTAEVKRRATPASVDTIPTSAGREDHVSMSMSAALDAGHALELATQVVAVELLCAAQALDLLQPLGSSPALAAVHAAIRARVPRLDEDRPPAPDIEGIAAMIARGEIEDASPVKVN